MEKGKYLLGLSWLGALALIALITTNLEQKESQFLGITDHREQFVSFPYPVEIRKIYPVEGEQLTQGDPLLEVVRPDLQSKKTILNHEIEKVSAEETLSQTEISTRLESVRAGHTADIAKIEADIHELETRQRINRDLVEKISGSTMDRESAQPDALEVKLSGLRKQHRLLTKSLNSTIRRLSQQLAESEKPNEAKIAKLVVEKKELERQQESLKMLATFDSRVGSVLFKAGEQVPAFTNILSLHSLAPRFVKGFIHEDSKSQISSGKEVWVSAVSDQKSHAVEGTIESLGSRIVEYPDRLKKTPVMQAWGREVVIRLKENNSFLMGEKVVVAVHKHSTMGEKLRTQSEYLASMFTGTGEQKNKTDQYNLARKK